MKVSAAPTAPVAAALAEPVAEELRAVEQALQDLLPANLPGPAPIVYQRILAAGGKRLRPLLTLLSCGAAGGVPERAIVLATGIEVVHLASLIHDDVVDEADQRRGQPTAREQWGNRVSILVGDLLIAQIFQRLSGETASAALGVVAGAVVQMCQAELAHDAPDHERPDERSYLDNIRGKTAALMGAACQMGGIAADNPSAEPVLREYGTCFGLAFQITDDLLDLYGDPAKLGKPVWQDLTGRKWTLPVLYALDQAPPRESRELAELLERVAAGEETLAGEVARMVEGLGGRAYAACRAAEYAARAGQAVRALADTPARRSLLGLAELVVSREG